MFVDWFEFLKVVLAQCDFDHSFLTSPGEFLGVLLVLCGNPNPKNRLGNQVTPSSLNSSKIRNSASWQFDWQFFLKLLVYLLFELLYHYRNQC